MWLNLRINFTKAILFLFETCDVNCKISYWCSWKNHKAWWDVLFGFLFLDFEWRPQWPSLFRRRDEDKFTWNSSMGSISSFYLLLYLLETSGQECKEEDVFVWRLCGHSFIDDCIPSDHLSSLNSLFCFLNFFECLSLFWGSEYQHCHYLTIVIIDILRRGTAI